MGQIWKIWCFYTHRLRLNVYQNIVKHLIEIFDLYSSSVFLVLLNISWLEQTLLKYGSNTWTLICILAFSSKFSFIYFQITTAKHHIEIFSLSSLPWPEHHSTICNQHYLHYSWLPSCLLKHLLTKLLEIFDLCSLSQSTMTRADTLEYCSNMNNLSFFHRLQLNGYQNIVKHQIEIFDIYHGSLCLVLSNISWLEQPLTRYESKTHSLICILAFSTEFPFIYLNFNRLIEIFDLYSRRVCPVLSNISWLEQTLLKYESKIYSLICILAFSS